MLRFKNKLCDKGFTLIELLGVIVLLAIIAIIALITVNRNIKNSQETLYKVQINNIKDGAKNWSTDNIKNIPDGETIYLTLAQLKQGGYVEENIKSPSDDKLCFPNDLQISIKSNESGSYEYNVENNDITYVSCENDTLDMTSPYIVLSKGDEVNGDNEVVDYVEIGQNGYDVPIATAFTSSGDFFSEVSSSSFKIEKISYKDNSNNTGNLVQSDYQASLQNGRLSLKINNITNIGRIYKIVYKLADGDKTVTAVRNVILQDTTPPEISINKTEDVIIYYKDNNQIKFAPYIFPTTALSITDNGGTDNVNYTVEGEKEINDYFKTLSNVSDYSPKEFPIIITATDASGNSSKKSQNIKFTLKEAKDPVINLYNSKNELLYKNSADDGVIKSYNNEWIDDKKLTIKIDSGCPIDNDNSYYIYNENNVSTKIYFNSLNINSKNDISFDINTIEGKKNLEVYATCGTVDSSLFPNPTVEMPSTQIKVDKTDPVCKIVVSPSSPDGSNNWYKTKPTVTYSFEEANDISGTFNNNGTESTVSDKSTHSVSITNDGTYNYTLSGTDASGKTCSKQMSVNVDTKAPICTIKSTLQDGAYTFTFGARNENNKNVPRISTIRVLNGSNLVQVNRQSGIPLWTAYYEGKYRDYSGYFNAADSVNYNGYGYAPITVSFMTNNVFNRFEIIYFCNSNTQGQTWRLFEPKFQGVAINFSNGNNYIVTTLPTNGCSYTSTRKIYTQTISPSRKKDVEFTASDSGGSGISGDSKQKCSNINQSDTCTKDFYDLAGNKATCSGS